MPNAMELEIVMVQVRLARWETEFFHQLESLSIRVGKPLATMAVRDHPEVPRGSCLFYFDPKTFGRVNCLYNVHDFEQVHALVNQKSNCRLVDFEPIPGRSQQVNL
jgi:hypothetical protein